MTCEACGAEPGERATRCPRCSPRIGAIDSSDQSWVSRHSGGLFVSGFGLVFTLAGLLILLIAVPSARARSTVVDSLAVVSTSTAADQPEGVRVLLEARIASDVPELFQDFVAFRRREFTGWKEEGGRRREQWSTREVVTPPLALGDGAHRIVIAKPEYEMQGEPHKWRSTTGLEYSLLGPSTQEVVGFRRGDAVTADGTLERGPQGLRIRATCLAGGASDAYRASQRESVLTLRIVGTIFSGTGGVVLAAGLFTLRRRAPAV